MSDKILIVDDEHEIAIWLSILKKTRIIRFSNTITAKEALNV